MDIFRRGGSGRLAKKKAPGQQILRPRTWQGVASEAEGEDEIQGGTNQSHASAGGFGLKPESAFFPNWPKAKSGPKLASP